MRRWGFIAATKGTDQRTSQCRASGWHFLSKVPPGILSSMGINLVRTLKYFRWEFFLPFWHKSGTRDRALLLSFIHSVIESCAKLSSSQSKSFDDSKVGTFENCHICSYCLMSFVLTLGVFVHSFVYTSLFL